MPTVNYRGKTVEFPDGTPKETMESALQAFGNEQPEVKAFNVGTQEKPHIVPAIPTKQAMMLGGEEQEIDETVHTPAPEARKIVTKARKLGVTPTFAAENPDESWEQQQDRLLYKISGLPSLRNYAKEGPYQADAISDDVNNLGMLDFALGGKMAWKVPPETYSDQSFPPNMSYLRGQAELGPEFDVRNPARTPVWLLEAGRNYYNTISNLKTFKEIKLDGAVDMERVHRERSEIQNVQLGQYSPGLKIAVESQDLAQNLAPYMLHPGVTFGLMYAEGTAQTYEALRQHGYDHQEAADVGEVAGFASAVVGTLTGQRLFGSLLPKATLQMVGDAVPGAVQRAFYDNPMIWKFMRDVGLNQLHATGMNVAMAVSNAAIVESYDAWTRRRPLNLSVFTDTINRSAMDSFKLLPMSIFAGMRQASHRAAMYELGGPFRESERATAESMDVEQRIYDEHEKQGHALRSLKEAADIDAAADAIQRSKFFKESPEEGKRLLQSMLHPRKTQSVFVNPEALAGLPEAELSKLDIKNMSEAIMSGAPAEVPMANFLTTPSVMSLTKDTAAAPDLLTSREAAPLATPSDTMQELSRLLAERQMILQEPEGPARSEKLLELEGRMRDAANNAPSHAQLREVNEAAPQAPTQEPKVASDKPMLGFRGKLSKERLSAWADGEVEGRTIGSLEGLRSLHRSNADAAERKAAKLQEQATGDLGRSTRKAQTGVSSGVEGARTGQDAAKGALSDEFSPGAVKNLIDRSNKWEKKAEDKGGAAVKEEVKAGDKIASVMKLEKIQKVNEAMVGAVEKARKEAGEIKQVVSDQSKTDARKQAYEAGWEFGAAHDGVVEALGGKQTGWSAPDVSDLDQKLREVGFSGEIDFDVKSINKLLQDPKTLDDMTLPEAREVQRFLKNMDDLTWMVTRIRSEGRMQKIEELRGHVIDYLEKVPFKPVGQRAWLDSTSALTLRQKFGAKKAELASEMNQPYTIFAKMGPVGDSLWFDGFVPARNREERLHDKFMPDFKAIDDAMPGEVRKTAKDIVPSMPGAPSKWGLRTRDEVWRLALHMGTQSGIDEISKSLGVSPVALTQWVQSNLGKTPEHRQAIMESFIQPTWKIFDKLWNEYEPALKERGRPPPKKLESVPFQIDGKTYSGGYGGRLRWTGEGWAHAVDPNSMAALFGLDYYGPSTPQAHLQERTGPVAGSFPDLQFSGIGSSLRSEIRDISFHGFVESTHKLLSPGLFRDTLSDKIGKQFVNQLYDPDNKTSWLHVVAQGRIPDLHTLSAIGIISNIQGRTAIGAFALNLKVVAMQLSHIPAMSAGMDLNPTWSIRSFNSERREWAEAVSQVLSYRKNDFERHNTELLGELTGVRPGEGVLAEKVPGVRALQNGLNKFNWEIWKAMDGRLSHSLWEMGLEKGLRRGMSQEDAIREADRTVQRGMPVQTIYEQSAFVRDRKMIGLMFLVRNFPNTLYNVSALNAWDARVQGKSAIPGAVGTGARYMGMVLAAEVIGKGFFGGHLPKDDEGLDEWIAANAVRSVFYPVQLDAPAEYVVRKAYGNDQAAKQALGHLTPPAMSTATQALENLGVAVGDDDRDGIRAAMVTLGIVTRMPIPRLYDWTKALFESDTPAEVVGRGAGYQRGE